MFASLTSLSQPILTFFLHVTSMISHILSFISVSTGCQEVKHVYYYHNLQCQAYSLKIKKMVKNRNFELFYAELATFCIFMPSRQVIGGCQVVKNN